MIGASAAGNFALARRADGGDDGGIAFLRELDGVMAHGPGAAGDEDARAVFGPGEHHRLIGGVGRNAEARSGLHADIGGQRQGLLRGQHDRLGGGTERAPPLAVPNPYPLAHARGRNAFAHAIDLARTVAVGNDAGKGDLARQAGAVLDIGRIDAGGGKPHPNLTGSRLWRLHLGDSQHLAGRAVLLVKGSAHACSFRRWIVRSVRMMPQNLRRDDHARRFTSPGTTSNMSALASISAKAEASAPVIQTCAPSLSSSA